MRIACAMRMARWTDVLISLARSATEPAPQSSPNGCLCIRQERGPAELADCAQDHDARGRVRDKDVVELAVLDSVNPRLMMLRAIQVMTPASPKQVDLPHLRAIAALAAQLIQELSYRGRAVVARKGICEE